ncbi:SinR family protein, partial [Flavobacterium sp. SOK18b]|nr:SinR family protein [Flavobacterium sp. SOK18b]
MVFCIAYDLNSPGRDYSTLIDCIRSYGTWWHHLDSTWFIVSENKTASQIRDELGKLID